MIRLPDSEWLAFEVGLKPAVRTTVTAADADRIATRATERGYAVVRADRPVQLAGRAPEEALYIARSAAHAQALKEAEAPVLPGTPPQRLSDEMLATHARIGALLGFPD